MCVQFTASFCETNIGYIRGAEKPKTGVKLRVGGDSHEGAHTFLFLPDEKAVRMEKMYISRSVLSDGVRCLFQQRLVFLQGGENG